MTSQILLVIPYATLYLEILQLYDSPPYSSVNVRRLVTRWRNATVFFWLSVWSAVTNSWFFASWKCVVILDFSENVT